MSAPSDASAETIPEAVIRAFPALDAGFEVMPGAVGLLHETRHLRTAAGDGFVLQRVSDVFAPAIHENIRAVTGHLADAGLETFRLVPTRTGALCFEGGAHGRWRLMTRLTGRSFDRVESIAQVASAAELVGRFHAALDDFDAPLEPMGMPFHDTAHERRALASALADHAGHPRRAEVEALRAKIDEAFEALGPAPSGRERVIHGDLKISNVLFAGAEPPERDRAVALIDFDTLMRAPLWVEWGDAWRSWCNRRGEDEEEASFDLEVFEASVRGFASGYGARVDAEEALSLESAVERIALELATRYATDALEERYFAWDARRFESAAMHNITRARGQIVLCRRASAVRDARRAILADALR